MMNDEVVTMLVNKVKEIEKDVQKNYLGKLTRNEEAKYKSDVVGLILDELNIIFPENRGDENEN